MHEKEIETALENVWFLVMYVNISEIASHIENENLSNWLSAWRGAMYEQILNIKEELK